MTSRSGSADVLAALGVNVDADVPTVEACLDELGICFCFAPLLHQSMKQVAPIRRQLGFRTIFNLLGPLANPAGAEYQLLGVGQARLRPLLAAALARLGVRRAVVVSGEDGLGEVTLAGADRGDRRRRRFAQRAALDARRFWSRSVHRSMRCACSGPDESAAMIRQVLAGEAGAARDVVVLNAAAGLWTAGHSESPRQAAELAAAAIDSGAAAGCLRDWSRPRIGKPLGLTVLARLGLCGCHHWLGLVSPVAPVRHAWLPRLPGFATLVFTMPARHDILSVYYRRHCFQGELFKMAKPHRVLKKANHGKRPANSKARRLKRKDIRT